MATPVKASNTTGAARAAREGRGHTFLLDYSYVGQSPEIKDQIVEMAMNASGIRDTARVLHVSTNTVMTELKKRNRCSNSSPEGSSRFMHQSRSDPGRRATCIRTASLSTSDVT
jgi:hypothetical protein